SPLSTMATYDGMRRTPWESTPRRLAQTRTSASSAASSEGNPTLMKMFLAKSWSSAAAIRIVSDVIVAPRRRAGSLRRPASRAEDRLTRDAPQDRHQPALRGPDAVSGIAHAKMLMLD